MKPSRQEPRRVGPTRRRKVVASAEHLVDIRPLFPDRPFPTLITPRTRGVRLLDWLTVSRDAVQALWEDKRALLFRGFEPWSQDDFRRMTDAVGEGPRLPYVDRSTPRQEYGDNVYCTTIYPAENTIRLHNEGSYWLTHARKAIFGCVTAPHTGGETPIGDVHAVHERIAPEIRAEFAERKWALVRNYSEEFALPWREVFQTQEKREVEDYCRKSRIEFEWRGGGRLRTIQRREPIIDHPRTGERLWHNHAAFFHITTREEPIRSALQYEFADDDLPYNTTYGDGGAIDPEVIRHINAAYDAELVKFTWEVGDVHMIDNLRLAHAREPYAGDRLILVALMEAWAEGSPAG
jgi:alpha-ketoglutarate-dependent taurine dioxygenase